MSNQIIISIFLNLIAKSLTAYLEAESNYLKPKLERNNILNKGLWMKNNVEKSNYGDFIFRTDSADVDNLLQNNFDAFGENYMDTVPVFSTYVERNKRAAIHKQKQRLRKSLRKCKDKTKCPKIDHEETAGKSKFLSKLKPASVFNDYPYEVAVLLTNSNKREANIANKSNDESFDFKFTTYNYMNDNSLSNVNDSKQTFINPISKITELNNTNISIPKRSMDIPLDFDAGSNKELEWNNANNKSDQIDGNKIERNVFDKEERMWQSASIQNVNSHKVIPRPESSVKNRPVTEKGLVKVLSLLTKTFRKVVKQHNEIQEIDNKLHSLNEDFLKNVAILDSKLQDFDVKYTQVLKLNEELKQVHKYFVKKYENLENKDNDMSKNLLEFQNQQKQFLAQQRQFYTIQKLMLEQNEKINLKQNMIAKTQSEISYRQNNFARVLKKAKQLYLDTKSQTSKLNSIVMKPKNISKSKINQENRGTTPTTPIESVKINLFSIPKAEPISNQDKFILSDKDEQPVDELIYKYYFNNTFIDNFMKNKVLTAIMNSDSKDSRNAKSKRNEVNSDTTVLLPIANPTSSKQLRRERRWIRKSKKSHKFHAKETATENKLDMKTVSNLDEVTQKFKSDPFLMMATNFCMEIGQNLTEQMLNWCIKKSLRRLKSIDMKIPIMSQAPTPYLNTIEKAVPSKAEIKPTPESTKLKPVESSTIPSDQQLSTQFIPSPEALQDTVASVLGTEKNPELFFPDNDELESNLKQYELKPDSEGTVFFDGSLHTSDIVVSESDGLSDIMPGLDSNSHVDVDPLALDLQAKRRASVRRLNKKILKMMRI